MIEEQKSIHENVNHGTVNFPYAIYHVRMPFHITSYPLHWHKEIEFIYVIDGTLTVSVNSRKFEMNRGDISVILPEQPHALFQYENVEANYINIVFNLEYLHSQGTTNYLYDKYIAPFVKGERSLDPYIPCRSLINAELFPYINELFNCRHESYTEDGLLIISDLIHIMHTVCKKSVEVSQDLMSEHIKADKVKKAVYKVQNCFHKHLTIAFMAEVCGVSESHFMKIFKDVTKQSFNEFLVNYRLEVAAKQLRESELKVIDIAVACGFNNHSYFTRAFIKKYGLTPVKYRRREELKLTEKIKGNDS